MPLAPPSESPTAIPRAVTNKDGRDGARSAVKSGGYCAGKTIPLIKPLALRVI